jgi:hypothetical protein
MPGTGDMPYLFVVEFSRRIEMTHIGFTMVCHMLPHYATLSIIILFHLLCGSLFISIHIWSLKRHWLQSSSQIEQHKWNKWNILYIKKWKKWILRYTFTSICIILLKKKHISAIIFSNPTIQPPRPDALRLACLWRWSSSTRWPRGGGTQLDDTYVSNVQTPGSWCWWLPGFFNHHSCQKGGLDDL